MIKLIASDLDGTLLTDKKEITELTCQALFKAFEQGISFVPATGRSFSAVPEAVLSLPGVAYVITSNGAAIYSVLGGERIYECLLAPESVEALLDLEWPDCVSLEVFVEGVPYGEKRYVEDATAFGSSVYGAEYVKNTRHSVSGIELFIRNNKEKIDSAAFVCGDPEIREALKKRIEKQIPDVYVTSSVPHMIEVGSRNAGKGKTLLKLLEMLEISPEEAMSFGDADNDLPMLTAVKYGVAMGNAAAVCRKAAAFVTQTNEEDGVAKAILKILDRKEDDHGVSARTDHSQ